MTKKSIPMTLPARYYTDPEVHRQEIERFYFGRWICAGRAERIPPPGDYFLCEVAGESVILTRDSNGVIRAFFNVCRHRGTRMCTASEGAFEGRIRCPYHGWTYGLDGSLCALTWARPTWMRWDFRARTILCTP